MNTKTCLKCRINKHYENFHLANKSKDKLSCICKECKSKLDKEYRIKNKEKLKLKAKEYVKKNKDKIAKKSKISYLKNKDKIDLYREEYRQKPENKKRKKENDRKYRQENKERRNKLERERNNKDPLYKLKNTTRKNILKKIKQQGFVKNDNTTNILGCSYQEFKSYLESKFESWMNWSNHGKHNGTFNFGWDIDHIIPMNSAKTEEDVIKLNHYTNLQPLCSKVNRDIKWKNI